MGNIISDSNNYITQNTELKKLIENWALNDYDAGLNYNKTGTPIKNLLRKRACCTRNPTMTIALPNIDLTHSKLIKEGYTPIKINVFNQSQLASLDIYSPLCKFPNENKSETGSFSYYQGILSKGTYVNNACSAIYMDGTTDLNLCKKIKNENKSIYSKTSQQAYGYYAEQPNNLTNYNNYYDCTCKNSILQDLDLNVFETNVNNKEMIVQNNDSYCKTCSNGGRCFIETNQNAENICINMANVERLTAQGGSSINNVQNCSISGSGSGTGNLPKPTSNPDGNNSNDISAIIEKYKVSIIIGFVILIASIVGTIVLLK
jgi:hypothetical protein